MNSVLSVIRGGLSPRTASRLATAFLFALALAAAGCNKPQQPSTARVDAQDVKKDAQQAVDTAGQFAQQEKDDFVNASQQQLEEAKQELARLKGEAQAAKGETKAKLDGQVEALQRKWDMAELRMEQLKQAGGESWKNLKQGMSDALADLRQSYEQAKQDLQRS